MQAKQRPALMITLAASTIVALALGSCSTSDQPAPIAKPRIAATTPILADVTRQVVGDQADVSMTIPLATDPRGYMPTPAQREQLVTADIVIANGLGIEAGFGDALDEARRRGHVVIEVAPQLSPLRLSFAAPTMAAGSTGTGTGTTINTGTAIGPTGSLDPHVWLDPDRMRQVTKLIADEVARLPRIDQARLTRAADDYRRQLDRADEEIQAALLPLFDAHRDLNVVTDADVLGYFAERYGVTVVGVATTTNGLELAATMVATTTNFVASTQNPPSATAAALSQSVVDQTGDQRMTIPGTVPGTAPRAHGVTVISIDVETLGPPGSGADTEVGLLTTLAHKLAEGFTR